MSATNTTTNYNLPIFIETDKPAWLVDFNGAMRSIDSQMKVNADAIATKSPILTFNDTADIDLTKTGNTITANLASAVSDKVGRALVTPIAAPAAEQIVSINTSGAQSVIDIGTGLALNSGVLNSIDLNLDDTGTFISTISNGTIAGGSLRYALNSDSSIGKIYGVLSLTGQSSGISTTITLSGKTVKASGTAYTISPTGILFAGYNPIYNLDEARMTISATGNITFTVIPRSANCTLFIFPCLYFFTDFGD